MIEACVGSIEEAIQAEKAGAGRLELCSALELGGLTPSMGLMQGVKAHTSLPVVVMIRPRAGGFCYDALDKEAMKRDAESLLATGADGIVFGCLTSEGLPELDFARLLCELAAERCTVFHRAFDFVPDPIVALEGLIDVGISRILTSGCAETAEAGIATLKSLQRRAAGRIEILPAGGIRAENVKLIGDATGCEDAHVGVSMMFDDAVTSGANNLNLMDARCSTGNRYRRLNPPAFAAAVRAHEQQT